MVHDSLLTSNSDEWNTPAHIVQAVIDVLEYISLDPCSNDAYHPNVPADNYYTKQTNGLKWSWHGKVYMNPPYGRDIDEWILHLDNEYRSGRVVEAIALLPARTDTAWFRVLRDYPKCFINGRLKFSGSENSATFPSVVVYMGKNLDKFARVFQKFGDVYERTDAERNAKVLPGVKWTERMK